MKIDFLKAQGSGNDFTMIDIRNQNISDLVKTEMSIILCNRDKSVGCDGGLFIEKSIVADGKLRIYNPDGSEGEMCGNGARVIGKYLMEQNNKSEVSIENITGLVFLVSKLVFFENQFGYKVDLAKASFKLDRFPMSYKNDELIHQSLTQYSDSFKFTAVSIPNPHFIVPRVKIDEQELIKLGKSLNENKNLIPNGTNLSFVKKISSSDVFVKTYERGAGITESCGTGICASVVALTKTEKLDFNTKINVYNDGGLVQVQVNEDYSCSLIGNATFEFRGVIDVDFNNISTLSFIKGITFDQEIEQYNTLLSFSKNVIQQILDTPE